MGGDTPQGPGFTVLEREGSKKSKSVDYESQEKVELEPQLREGRVRLGGESQARTPDT